MIFFKKKKVTRHKCSKHGLTTVIGLRIEGTETVFFCRLCLVESIGKNIKAKLEVIEE